MFAPPGVDSSSSGEETTPPPSLIPQRVKPKFSFRSLFSPISGGSSRTQHSRTLRKGKVRPPTNEEIKHSTPVEAAEADPDLPTDENDLLTPKKRVRIYAGELQSGERARGLTNNLGEGVRDSQTLPAIKNQETLLDTDNKRNDNNIGISEEVYMMLKRFTDEQKELEHAEREQQEEMQIQPTTRTSSVPISNFKPDDTPLRKGKAQAKSIPKPKPIITDTSLEDSAQLSPSPTPLHDVPRGGDAEQSKPTDILLRLKSSASSLSKKRSLKSLKSIKYNKKSLSAQEIPPIPPVPKDCDEETVMISRTPIADKFARPQNLLVDQLQTEQPQTAPPAVNGVPGTSQNLGTAAEYYQSGLENIHPPYCPHCHSPRTAPSMPYYPSTPPNIAQNRGWCQPPGWAIHPYYPVSPPLSFPFNYPHLPVMQEHTISDHHPPEMNLSAEENRQTRGPSSSQDVKNVAGNGKISAEPALRSGPMREVRKYEGEKCESVQGEIGRSSHLKNGGGTERDATQSSEKSGHDGKKDLNEEGRLMSGSQSGDKVKDRDSCSEEMTKLRPSDERGKPRSAEGQIRSQDQRLGQKDKLERIVRQYKAEYSDAVKYYETSGLHQNEREKAKEKVKRAEAKLKEAAQALREQGSTRKVEGKELKGQLVEAEQGREKLAAKKEAMKDARKGPKDDTPLVRKHNFTNATALPENECLGLTADQQKMNGHLEDLQEMVEKYQVLYKQAMKIYKSEGLSEEKRKAAKEQVKKADMRMKENMQALQAARNELEGKGQTPKVEGEREGNKGDGDHPMTDVMHQKESDEQVLKRVGEDVEVEDRQMRRSPAGDDVSGRSKRPSERGGDRKKEELELLVKKYKARHNAAMKAYKVDDLTDNQRQAAKKEVVRAQGKLKEAMQALIAFQNSPQKPDGRNANHAKGEDGARKAKDGSTEPDSAAKMKDIKDVSQSGEQITRTPDQDNDKKSEDLEGLVQKYRIRHKELIKAYKAEGLPEEKKKQAHKTEQKTDSRKTDDGNGDTKPKPSKVEESGPGSATENDIEDKVRDLEKTLTKYQIEYKQSMESYRQGALSEEKKKEAKDNLRSIESRIKEGTRNLEKLKQTNGKTNRNHKVVEQDTKTEISDWEESPQPKPELSSKTLAAEPLSSNKSKVVPRNDKVKRLEEMVKQYQIRHKEAVRQLKSGALTEEQREQAKVSVKRIEVKLKESLQALKNIKADTKAETKADSSQQRQEQTDGVREKKQGQLAAKGCSDTQAEGSKKAEGVNDCDHEAKNPEETIKPYQLHYKDAVKKLEVDGMTEIEKKEAKENVIVAETKLKKAMQALKELNSKEEDSRTANTSESVAENPRHFDDNVSHDLQGKTEEAGGQNPNEVISAQNTREDKIAPRSELDTPTVPLKKSQPDLTSLEAAVKKYKMQHQEAIKRYKTADLSEDDKKKAKEQVKLSEVKLSRALERLQEVRSAATKREVQGNFTSDQQVNDQKTLVKSSPRRPGMEFQLSQDKNGSYDGTQPQRAEIEAQIKRYQEQHREALKMYKSPESDQMSREVAKEQIKKIEEILKQAIKASHALDPPNDTEDTVSSDQSSKPRKQRTKGVSSPFEENSDVEKLEEQLRELKSSYAEAIKLYKSKRLSESDKKKAKEKVMYLEQKVKQSQKGLSQIAKNGSASSPKSEKGLEEAETVQKQIKATANWDKALKEYVTTPDITQEQREEARMKVKAAKGEYDVAQRGLKVAQEITGSNDPELPEKEPNAQERNGKTSGHSTTRDFAQTRNLKDVPNPIAGSPAPMTSKPKELDKEVPVELPKAEEGATSEGFNHQAWAPLRLSSKGSWVPPTPSKSPTTAAVRKIQPGPLVEGDVTWSKTLISLAICIDLVNRILVSLNDSPSPNPITEIVQNLIIGLMMQKDVLLSLKEVVGEQSAGMIDEFGEHVAIIKSYVEDLMIERKEGTLEDDGVMRAEKAVEKGLQVLENVEVQSIVNHLMVFTEYLAPGMIDTLKEIASEWKREGLGMKVIIHTVLAIRKELAVIQRSKEHPKQIEEKKRTEGLIGTLDKVLALFSSDHSDSVLVADPEFKTKRSNLSAPTEQQSEMTSSGSMLRKEVRKDKGKKREDYIDVKAEIRPGLADNIDKPIQPGDIPTTSSSSKLFPISSSSSLMPRSHTPIEEPSSSLSHLMSKISNKLHHSKSPRPIDGKEKEKDRKSRPRPIITPSPHQPLTDNESLKLPQTTQTFLRGGSSWKRRTGPRRISSASLASTSSSFSATIPYTAPLPSQHDRQRTSSGDTTAPSTPYTPGSELSPEGSSPSTYSQTSVESGSTSTAKSDRLARELLAQADSGPQAVKHDWRNDLDSSNSSEGRVEPDDSQVKRAEDVLYNKVLPVPDTSRGGRRRGDYI
ncbi:hypothetical protein V865_007749 [Kwoniella europaea PYCC6329]|uniref:Uncharacterized protein n=1 Tax=Kwoniella europaea PYCC6329 TaxID=1423913 RepID=A0AAX4KT49_9TREE